MMRGTDRLLMMIPDIEKYFLSKVVLGHMSKLLEKQTIFINEETKGAGDSEATSLTESDEVDTRNQRATYSLERPGWEQEFKTTHGEHISSFLLPGAEMKGNSESETVCKIQDQKNGIILSNEEKR